MRYRLEQIKLNPQEIVSGPAGMKPLETAVDRELGRALARKGIHGDYHAEDIRIIKESVDARKKPDVKVVYTVEFACRGKNSDADRLPLPEASVRKYRPVESLNGKKGGRPVIAGFGPCGMFAALILAEAGLRPIVLERGKAVDERVEDVRSFWQGGRLNPESNVQFGEGGAGTFSDGKLTTGTRDIRKLKVTEELIRAGADEKIAYKNKPHVGTDRLREIVKNIRMRVEELGGEILFSRRLDDLFISEGRLTGILVRDNLTGCSERMETEELILAVGHSARDTFHMLKDKGIEMEQKPFSIGVRITHSQDMINRAQYGDAELAKYLGAADYKLNHRCENGRGVYTFCMCPGGEVIDASTEPGGRVTNGMSNSRRDSGYANSGLLVDVRCEDFGSDDPLAGIEFQRKYEALAFATGGESTYGEFRDDTDDNPVRMSLPGFATEAILEAMPHLGRKLEGFDRDDSLLQAVESRSSSPVRICRNENMEASVSGIYPAGEGPGYAGGIMSAAVDGIRVAERIIDKYNEQQ